MKGLKQAFIAIENNKVIIITRFYSDFYKRLKEIEPNCRGRDYFKNKFSSCKQFSQWIEGTQYFFQYVENNN